MGDGFAIYIIILINTYSIYLSELPDLFHFYH